jgi:tetratricopeptide (TPR) repeat protein
VVRYGVDSEFRRANPSGWQRAQPLVKTHLVELARFHHALAQKNKQTADVQEAIRWYDLLLTSFPADAEVPANRFLLAELLFDDKRFERAAKEFNTVAYPATTTRTAPFARAADAGYSALLATTELEKAGADKAALRRQSVQSGLLFAKTFPGDPRVGSVLTNAAEQLLSLKDGDQALAVARQALTLTPPPAPELRRVAWTVVALQTFDSGEFATAEAAYGEVLALTAERAAGRAELIERQAAAIYKQGEAAREAGQAREAVGHFARIAGLGALPVASAVRASALLDTAVALIGLKDWDAAARTLENFRRQHPNHPAQADVAPKLALAYMEGGKPAQAAVEFERVAATAQDPVLARGAQWQAAELRQKAWMMAADKAAPKSPLLATAIKSWERYLQAWPQPAEPAVQARWHLAQLTKQDNQLPRSAAWLRAVQAADRDAGDARTPVTRSLGGQATLMLSEPLAKQLKLKKARMDDVLKAYAQASEAGVADVTTAATFQTAALYQDFGKAMIGSQRPKGLKKLELEQYNVLLEEQAFPFEEKAIELHETNARRTTQGLWDVHVQKSLAELAKLKPVRYGKVERGDPALGSDMATLQAAADKAPASPAVLNQLGLAQRQAGQFDAARKTYEAALAADPKYLPAQLNLAILLDLYMGDLPQAQLAYQKSLELSPGDAAQLNRWMAELKGRKPAAAAAPATASPPSPATTTTTTPTPTPAAGARPAVAAGIQEKS